MSKKQCKVCGGLVGEEMNFCPYCGMTEFKSIGVIDLVNEQEEEEMYSNNGGFSDDMYISNNINGNIDTSNTDMNTVLITENDNSMMDSSPISLYKPEHLRRNYNPYNNHINNMSYSMNEMSNITEKINGTQNISQMQEGYNNFEGNNIITGMHDSNIGVQGLDSRNMYPNNGVYENNNFLNNNEAEHSKKKQYSLVAFGVAVFVTLTILGIYFGMLKYNESKKAKANETKKVSINTSDILNGIFNDVNKDGALQGDENEDLETLEPEETIEPEATPTPKPTPSVQPTSVVASTTNSEVVNKTNRVYTKGEFANGSYTNTWLNIKYIAPSEYSKASETEYNTYEGTNRECGFYIRDTSGNSLSLVIVDIQNKTKITARKFLENSFEETKKDVGEFNYKKVEESNVIINDIKYESMHCSVDVVDETVIHSMYAAIIDDRIVCFIATSDNSKEDNNSKIANIQKYK